MTKQTPTLNFEGFSLTDNQPVAKGGYLRLKLCARVVVDYADRRISNFLIECHWGNVKYKKLGWKISCCCSFKVASDIEYAHSLGIEVGGYDLIALTRVVQQQWMAVNNDEYPRLENSLYIMQVKKFLQENEVVDKRQMRL